MRASGIATAQTAVAAARFASSLVFGALWTALGRSSATYALAGALAVAVVAAWVLLRGVGQTAPATSRSGAVR